MAIRKYMQMTVRFSLRDERQRRLYKQIEDYDMKYFGSKNNFFLTLAERYFEGTLEPCKSNSDEGIYVTKEDLKQFGDKIKQESRTEIYQELIAFLAKTGVTAGLMNAGCNVNHVTTSVEETNVEGDVPQEVLDDVMKWS